MADGQRALVVLLPLNGNMNVQMSNAAAGPATVTVGGVHKRLDASVDAVVDEAVCDGSVET